MLDMIASGLSALNSAREIAKGIATLKEEVAVQLKAAELLTIIADAQGSLNEAQSKISELQADLRNACDELAKRAEFERYQLVEPFPGTFMWRLDESRQRPGEPMHDICPHCREDGKLSILMGPGEASDAKTCKRCKKAFQVRPQRPQGRIW